MAAGEAGAFVRLDAEFVAVTLVFLVLIVVACLMPAQTDTWWQLRAGEEMWRTHRILLRDVFTHTVAGAYWPNHEWLTQVIFYAVYRIGGLPLLTACCAAAVASAWFIVYRLTIGSTPFRLTLVGVAAALSTAGWSLRPLTLTLFFFAATLWILVRRQMVWLLPPLFLVWANLHGAVAAGGILLVAAICAAAVLAPTYAIRLLAVAGACLLATAATPLGFSLWAEIPASLARLKTYNVLEWKAPQPTNPGDLPFWAVLTALTVTAIRARERLRTIETATLVSGAALTAVLALRSTRNIGLFLLCATPAVSRLLTQMPVSGQRPFRWPAPFSKALIVGALALTIGIVAYAWSRPVRMLNWRPLSPEVFAAIASCEGPLYNRYDEGGEIIWFLKGRKVFLDSRQDPFPEKLVLEQLHVEQTGDYEELFGRYGIRCALTDQRSALAAELRQRGWREITTRTPLSVFNAGPDAHPQR